MNIMSEACGGLTVIPDAGPFLAAACEGAEGIVGAAVTHAKQELAAQADAGADAGAPPPAALALKPLYATRHGKRRHVGYAPACLCAAAQRYLDARADDAGSPVTMVVVDAGGKDGGS